MRDMRTLWQTNVGSWMWGMNHPGSDIDVYEVVQVPTKDILLGRARTSFPNRVEYAQPMYTSSEGTVKRDVQTHEIGSVVTQLLDGNTNALWGVFSPISLGGRAAIRETVRVAAEANFSRRSYRSLEGLARHNIRKYIETGKDVSIKRLNIIARTLRMGITLLAQGRIEFVKTSVTTPDEVYSLVARLGVARDNSILPENPPRPELLESLLVQLRIEDLLAAGQYPPVDAYK